MASLDALHDKFYCRIGDQYWVYLKGLGKELDLVFVLVFMTMLLLRGAVLR